MVFLIFFGDFFGRKKKGEDGRGTEDVKIFPFESSWIGLYLAVYIKKKITSEW